MRIRSVKPEFWKSESNGKLSHSARLLFIGLFNHADDEGVFRAAPALIRAEIFPYDDITLEGITVLLRELSGSSHKVVLYTGPDGDRYGFIPSFKAHQVINKPLASKLPKPPENWADSQIHVAVPEDSGSATVGLRVGMEGKGKEKEGIYMGVETPGVVEKKAFQYPDDFAAFWEAYPLIRRKDKLGAFRKWATLKKNGLLPPLEKILQAVESQKHSQAWRKDGGQYIPGPEVWLYKGRWDDYEERDER
jgi:hypothetical protein